MPGLRHSTSGEVISFERRLRVGRSTDSDLCLARPSVSWDHAVLEYQGGALTVRDLGSRNGTAVAGGRISAPRRLTVGDELRFGPDAAWVVAWVDVLPTPGRSAPTLEVVASGHRVPLSSGPLSTGPLSSGRVVLGATEIADLRLPGPAVSALISRQGGALQLIRVDPPGPALRLDDGVIFVVAGVELRFHARGPVGYQATRLEPVGLHLTLIPEGPGEGSIHLRDETGVREISSSPNRYVLVWALARARKAGDDDGWISDEDLRVLIWGRRGAQSRSDGTFAKLVHDARRMFTRNGVVETIIEKRRGRTRLALAPEQVSLQGDG